MSIYIRTLLFILCSFASVFAFAETADTSTQVKVPILTYHRLAPTAVDSMTLPVSVFASQLKWLKDNDYKVIPLKTLVDYLEKKGPAPPEKSVVITFDDGHKSVETYLLPLVQQYKIPVTLFIYPSAISNASYALTWEQLAALQKMGNFDIQGHTYWHPNFKQDKKKMTPEAYQKFVTVQLVKSKAVLEKKLGISIDLLAWPFGIYDADLEKAAAQAGYQMAFSIDGRPASQSENAMSQPRYMIIHQQSMQDFETIMDHHGK
jgi:peptidoglycan/xylan/chitin deacetylase (PgdA/CDA1 family)